MNGVVVGVGGGRCVCTQRYNIAHESTNSNACVCTSLKCTFYLTLTIKSELQMHRDTPAPRRQVMYDCGNCSDGGGSPKSKWNDNLN